MIPPEYFYKGFQLNHFDNKQLSNQFLLELSDEKIKEITKHVLNSSVRDFKRSVKIDIRLTFLLAVESLFEMIFGLLPNKNGLIEDKYLLYNLSKPSYNSEDIRNYANNEKSKLDFLHEKIKYKDGRLSIFMRHVFYFGIQAVERENEIESSISTLEKTLRILAKELSIRDELNSYKHGMRGINFFKKLIMKSVDKPDSTIEFGVDESVTVFSIDKQTNSPAFFVKSLDTSRDIELTTITANLIYNIIYLRRVYFYPGKELPLFFIYNDDQINAASKENVQIQNLRYSMNPVKENKKK